MKKLILLLSSAFVLIFSQYQTMANKIMASDLTWRCIGQDSFLVKLIVYTDCNGEALISTPIIASCFQIGTEITRISLNIGTPVDVTPVAYCVSNCNRCMSSTCPFPYGIQRYAMQSILNLSNARSCCKIKIEWQQCCRAYNSIISGTPNYYTEAVVDRCIKPCDNSPVFCGWPIDILCNNYSIGSCGATDIDLNKTGGISDSLVYEWTAPLIADSIPITYLSPYSYDKPLYFSGFPYDTLPYPQGFHLEHEAGGFQFQPKKNGTFIFVEKLIEYREGKYIGEIRHEFYFIVISCPPNNPPEITTQNDIRAKSVCVGDTVSFDFFTSDPNVKDTIIIMYNGLPGSIWTNTNGQAKHPTGRLIWAPSDAYVSSLPYTFYVTAKDDACPIMARFTQEYKIFVKPRPRASIVVTDSGGGNYWFRAQKIEGSAPTYIWQGDSFSFTPNTGPIVWHKFQPGKYPYTMTMTGSGCSNTYFDTVYADTTSGIISNRISKSDFKIYPNPASDYVNIEYKGLSKWEGRLLLFDPASKLVISRQLDFNQTNKRYALSLNGFTPGIYLIRLENISGSVLFLLLVQ
jgi:hypothetical protein